MFLRTNLPPLICSCNILLCDFTNFLEGALDQHEPGFIGRQRELDECRMLLNKKSATLAVVKGRRRVGKSRLIEEFARGKKFISLTGNWPDDRSTAQSQRDEFSRQLSLVTDLPDIKADSWYKLFILLAKEVQRGQTIILLDEISWMGSKDASFLSTLKNVWESHFKKNAKLIVILCGSVSTWIDKNILSSSGYFGRIAWELSLQPLSLRESSTFLDSVNFKSSPYKKFKILSITGGIPWYLEQIQGRLNANENIKRQCFNSAGVLFREFDRIFSDLFGTRSKAYKKIIKALVRGSLTYSQLAEKSGYKSSGRLSEYLNDLESAGFLSQDNTWSIRAKKQSDLCRFRLKDNYLRFYLKYIEPKFEAIKRGEYLDTSMTTLPGYDSIMGLQFENLVVENRKLLWEICHIKPEDILMNNPYFQRKTTTQEACQIDYLIQTKYHTLYLFEIKFSRNPIKKLVVQQVKQKIKHLALPSNTACLPVLVHVNGVDNSLVEEDYFFRIIDFNQLLD